MNQIKIGKFIAACRKNKNLTQAELAEKLNITDKAISKWETGKGMPDSSIMLELCNILDISANELLKGDYIANEVKSKETDENIVNILNEYKRMKKRKNELKIILIILSILIVSIAVTIKISNHIKEHNYSTINISQKEEDELYSKCLEFFINRHSPNIFHIKNKDDKPDYNVAVSDFKVFTRMQKIGIIRNGDNIEVYMYILSESYHVENNNELVSDSGGVSIPRFTINDNKIIKYEDNLIKDTDDELKKFLPNKEMFDECKKCQENSQKLSGELRNEVKKHYSYLPKKEDVLIHIDTDIETNQMINNI